MDEHSQSVTLCTIILLSLLISVSQSKKKEGQNKRERTVLKVAYCDWSYECVLEWICLQQWTLLFFPKPLWTQCIQFGQKKIENQLIFDQSNPWVKFFIYKN